MFPSDIKQEPLNRLLSASQVALWFGWSVDKVYRLARLNKIPYVKIRHRTFFVRDDLKKYLEGAGLPRGQNEVV